MEENFSRNLISGTSLSLPFMIEKYTFAEDRSEDALTSMILKLLNLSSFTLVKMI
jgi:hypothetical protein